MIRRLYDWVVSLADRPSAAWALGLVAFAESSVFIVPPDLLLAPMALAHPQKAWRYALICTFGSVTGGILGYAIGHLLFESAGLWILTLYGYADKIDVVKDAYARYGAALILLKGLTPIPFKLVCIVSGALDYNFPLFVFLSIITRGGRFYILAALLHRFGDRWRHFIENHIGLVLTLITLLTLIGIFAAVKLA